MARIKARAQTEIEGVNAPHRKTVPPPKSSVGMQSPFIGVNYHRKAKAWRAAIAISARLGIVCIRIPPTPFNYPSISAEGRSKHLRYSKDQTVCARAFDLAMVQLMNDGFAPRQINFPDDLPQYQALLRAGPGPLTTDHLCKLRAQQAEQAKTVKSKKRAAAPRAPDQRRVRARTTENPEEEQEGSVTQEAQAPPREDQASLAISGMGDSPELLCSEEEAMSSEGGWSGHEQVHHSAAPAREEGLLQPFAPPPHRRRGDGLTAALAALEPTDDWLQSTLTPDERYTELCEQSAVVVRLQREMLDRAHALLMGGQR